MRKRVWALLLGMMLLSNGLSCQALAAPEDPDSRESDVYEDVDNVWVNPMYRDVESADNLEKLAEDAGRDIEGEDLQEERAGAQADAVYLPMKKAAASLRRQLVRRTNVITVRVQAKNVKVGKVASALFDEAVSVDKDTAGDEGDYILYHMGGYGGQTSGYPSSGEYSVTYVVRYYTNWWQEVQVTAKVKQILSSLGVRDMNAYGKVKTIYDHICRNVDYDYATLNDDTVGKFTAYNALMEGTAVCQGYANLFYRMAVEAGVRTRVIGGTSRSVPHAWNIVKLDRYYYNLDSTWDAGRDGYVFFLKSSEDFGGHTRDKEYRATSFQTAHPMAPASYKNGTVTRSVTYNIKKAKVSGIKTKTYTGKRCTQSPVLRLDGVKLKRGRDYTVSYKNNVKIGTATIIFKGKGRYVGTLKKKYKIVIKKGFIYKVGGRRYQVVNANTNGRGTVRQVGAAKKVERVKIGGKRFRVLG